MIGRAGGLGGRFRGFFVLNKDLSKRVERKYRRKHRK